ncbi:MAG: hypothetical protein ABIR28_11260 [Vicinamibacteria bacterium]
MREDRSHEERASRTQRVDDGDAVDTGYWYTTELKEFATCIGVPSAGKLRKDELEKALRHFIRFGEVKNFVPQRGVNVVPIHG